MMKRIFYNKIIALRTMPVFLTVLFLSEARSQVRISIQAAIDSAYRHNLQFAVNEAEMKKTGFNANATKEVPKTGVFVENEDLRPSDSKGVLKIGLSQSITWPGLAKTRKEYFQQQLKYYQLNVDALKTTLKKEVSIAYYELWFLQDKNFLYQRLDSIYTSLYKAAELRFKTGEAAGLEKIAADAKMKELRVFMEQNQKDILMLQQQLMLLLNSPVYYLPLAQPLEKLKFEMAVNNEGHPLMNLQTQNIALAKSDIEVQKNSNKPEFSGRLFSQRLWGARNPYTGFSVTAAFPIFGKAAFQNKIKAANTEVELQQHKLSLQQQQLNTEQAKAVIEIEKNLSLLQYYESVGLQQSEEIIKAASLSYRAGEISFAELSQFLSQAIDTRKNYLEVLNNYNQSVIQYNFYNNK